MRPDEPHYNNEDCRDNDVLNCTHVFGDTFPVVAQHCTGTDKKYVPQQTANERTDDVRNQFNFPKTCRN
jgi:hypothetical protein